jgi:ABC-type glycerol-3-phosphate transport system substrate-binding protein
MHSRTPQRAAKRITTFAAAFVSALLLFFCASGDVGSAQQYRRTTTTTTPAAYDPARPVNVAVNDYTVTTTGGAIVVTDVFRQRRHAHRGGARRGAD